MYTKELNQLLIDATRVMRDEIQANIEVTDFYCFNVRKAEWPKATAPYGALITGIARTKKSFGVKEIFYHLKKCTITSPDICLEDMRTDWQVQDVTRNIQRILRENSKWIWSQTFQREVIANCEHRSVVRKLPEALPTPEGSTIVDSSKVIFPRKVNFFGRPVHPYGRKKQCVSKKYKRAAEQVVVFHPDIVEFLFPDLEHWVANIAWINILDCERNPYGTIGFYRALMAYAAKPLRPDLGYVITVIPPGIKGFLWYWAWKIVRYVP